ncbi:MAG: antitoxin VapB family protein [Thaumarchaeota archaeon]|nr:antitoxin VapB family protein [Nitrososphaerota archaeon]
MATKCITITTGAYEKLAALKESRESFSDVINRVAGRSSLLELVGILSHKEADELKGHVKDLRKRFRKRVERTAARIK